MNLKTLNMPEHRPPCLFIEQSLYANKDDLVWNSTRLKVPLKESLKVPL